MPFAHPQIYYDEHATAKIRDFVDGNPRIERAWQTICRWAPHQPSFVLEIGCGIGYVCARMARRWAGCRLVGLDISPRSVDIARRLFASDRISFVQGRFQPGLITGAFDLIILMDVYEHIPPVERPMLHGTVRDLLTERGRIILTVPTPRHLSWLKRYHPEEIQPVDEDITVGTLLAMSHQTHTELLLYEEIGIWQEEDYAHAVLGRPGSWNGSDLGALRPSHVRRATSALATRLGRLSTSLSRFRKRALVWRRLGEHVP